MLPQTQTQMQAQMQTQTQTQTQMQTQTQPENIHKQEFCISIGYIVQLGPVFHNEN